MKFKIVRHTHRDDFIGWIALDKETDVPIGWANITFKKDKKIKFQDAFVLEPYRRNGIYKALWNARWKWIKDNYGGKGYTVEAWAKEMSIGQFIKNDFVIGETCTYVSKEI